MCEIPNDHGAIKGWCPLGGGIEFGESSHEALKREIFEETGYTIQIIGGPIGCENIFEHHGAIGHEIILAFPIRFDDAQVYAQRRFQIRESNGALHWAEWIEISRFQSGELTFFPETLIGCLNSMR